MGGRSPAGIYTHPHIYLYLSISIYLSLFLSTYISLSLYLNRYLSISISICISKTIYIYVVHTSDLDVFYIYSKWLYRILSSIRCVMAQQKAEAAETEAAAAWAAVPLPVLIDIFIVWLYVGLTCTMIIHIIYVIIH